MFFIAVFVERETGYQNVKHMQNVHKFTQIESQFQKRLGCIFSPFTWIKIFQRSNVKSSETFHIKNYVLCLANIILKCFDTFGQMI
jgi:hypothetical protein